MPCPAAFTLSGNQSCSNSLKYESDSDIHSGFPVTYTKTLQQQRQLQQGNLLGELLYPGNTQQTLMTFDKRVLWESKPVFFCLKPEVISLQTFVGQAIIYELNLGLGELHIGKNLISLCNNEAFPFHYLSLEQHPVQTPARILFMASSPGSINTDRLSALHGYGKAH